MFDRCLDRCAIDFQWVFDKCSIDFSIDVRGLEGWRRIREVLEEDVPIHVR